MSDKELTRICAQRLKANDFAQEKNQPLLTRNETIAAVVMLGAVALIMAVMISKTYFA
ncbi:hypothetical protein IL972_00165 [Acinetobacter sp. FL51]|uniref:hypothetical protein n=1 Tax=Acinetobacter sp. FL51 TaxID=2777978 RepID=UPI0018E140C0|nr:hypothetical protein [Acinetobacter sp. FL51]MBI1450352.1 hypothetical protein [Acinetobacter sp. FL51]